MSLRLLLALLLSAQVPAARAAVAPPAAPAAAEPDRSHPVPLDAPHPLAIPDLARHTMANGMRLAVIELGRMGLVSVKWVFPYAGSASDPAGKDGLAGFVASLMVQGAGPRDSSELTIALMGQGASVAVSATRDFMTVTLTAEKDKLDEAMRLAADVIRRPALPQPELDRHRRQTRDGLRSQQAKPEYWAGRLLAERLYGDHPYARPVTEASVAAIGRSDLAAFQQGRVIPSDAVMGASGLTLAELEVLAERHFGDWAAPGPVNLVALRAEVPALRPEDVGPAPGTPGWTIDLFDQPDKAQADLTLAFRTITEREPDYLAFRLAVAILGEGSLGRLYRNLREEKRWSYGAYSDLSTFAKAGAVTIEASVQKDKAGPAVAEILAEILTLRTQPVPDAEISTMKQYLYGAFVRAKQGVGALAASAAFIELDGDPADYIAAYRSRLFAVTAEQVLAAAQGRMAYAGIHIIVVGDAAALYPQLAPIGTVRVHDQTGRELPAYRPVPGERRTSS